MARGVNHDAAVGEARRVKDLRPVDDVGQAVPVVRGRVDQLAEALKASAENLQSIR